MSDWMMFGCAAACAAVLSFAPGYLWARLCRVPSLYALGAGPALTAGAFGMGAILVAEIGIPWHLGTAAVATIVVAVVFALAGKLLQGPPLPEPVAAAPMSWRARAVSVGLVFGAVTIAVGPILHAMPSPDAILQRWDALFHLSAVEHVRGSGDGSTLTLGSLAYSDGRDALYPAAFHDIAALVPFASTPVTVNAAAITMALLPWCFGLGLLVRTMWPHLVWGPTAAAALGALAPASPLNEWVHLSPTPNLVAFSFLPGLAALVLAAWNALRQRRIAGAHGIATAGVIVALGTAGLTLLHPNVLVAFSLLTFATTAVATIAVLRRDRTRWHLALVPLLAILPTAAIVALPGSSVAQDFDGGLAVPLWQAVGEVGLGLLTIWPMPLGVFLWLLAWIGVWALVRRGGWGPLLCGAIAVILYLDAAVDSPLNLSVLWYRGQDRLAMLVSLIAVPLAVAGLAHLLRWWKGQAIPLLSSRISFRAQMAVALLIAVVIAAWSMPMRYSQAALNFDLDLDNRNRYFDSAEWEMLKSVGPALDTEESLLASPFSGGSHLYALTGQSVRFPTAGHALRPRDLTVIEAAANPTPENCKILTDGRIGYIYVDSRSYNFSSQYAPLHTSRLQHYPIVASTEHSALYRVDCSVWDD